MKIYQRAGLAAMLGAICIAVIVMPSIFVDGTIRPGSEWIGFIIASLAAFGAVSLIIE